MRQLWVCFPTTGGDDDFIIIDINARQFAWFENGFSPTISELCRYRDKRLSELFGMRHSNNARSQWVEEDLGDEPSEW